MGFVLSLLYFVTYYLTPATAFGPLAAARIELVLGSLVLLVSLPTLTKSIILRTSQSLALAGLGTAIFLSILMTGWVGGAAQAFLSFIPNVFGYFLVCLHCNTRRRLRMLVVVMVSVCLFVIAHGSFDLLHGVPQSDPDRPEGTKNTYLMAQTNDNGESFYRLRGLGQINDPNDFAQLIVCVIPLVFIFWRKTQTFHNIGFVLLPVGALLCGVFLTHSRGALLALVAMAVVAGKRRIGTLPSLVLAGCLFVAASALHFTGGREISAESGSDRTALWGQGLQILKAHPFFGVGFGRMPEYTDAHLTAHNSVVVCAAELGLVGLYFWCMFLFPTMRNAIAVASPTKVCERQPIVPEQGLFPQPTRIVEALNKDEINHMGRLVVFSLTGFLVTGWFLSRAFVLTLFLLGGVAEIVFEIALQRGMIGPRLPVRRVLLSAGGLAISLVLLMYILLRIVNLMH